MPPAPASGEPLASAIANNVLDATAAALRDSAVDPEAAAAIISRLLDVVGASSGVATDSPSVVSSPAVQSSVPEESSPQQDQPVPETVQGSTFGLASSPGPDQVLF